LAVALHSMRSVAAGLPATASRRFSTILTSASGDVIIVICFSANLMIRSSCGGKSAPSTSCVTTKLGTTPPGGIFFSALHAIMLLSAQPYGRTSFMPIMFAVFNETRSFAGDVPFEGTAKNRACWNAMQPLRLERGVLTDGRRQSFDSQTFELVLRVAGHVIGARDRSDGRPHGAPAPERVRSRRGGRFW
jgi:hypothetical protein